MRAVPAYKVKQFLMATTVLEKLSASGQLYGGSHA